MSSLGVHGIGLVGGFGTGLDAFSAALDRAPTTGEFAFLRDGCDIRQPALTADPAELERFVPKRATRRIDHFSRLALLGAFLALEDAGVLDQPRERLGVIIASGYGPTRTTFAFLDSLLDDGDSCASPTHFSNSVHNAAAAHVAMQLGATGPNLTVSQFELSVASALATAAGWLAAGRVDRVLFGAVDELCPVLGHCRERLFPGETPDGLAGEGAAFFLLGAGDGVHGRISRVETGSLAVGLPELAGAPFCLVGKSGFEACDGSYHRLLPTGVLVADLLPAVGAMPTGQGFDLAAALLALREGCWPPRGGASLAGGEACCLKVDADGRFGLVLVARGDG